MLTLATAAVALAVLLVTPNGAITSASSDCAGLGGTSTQACTSNTGSSIEVGATQTHPGSADHGSSGDRGDGDAAPAPPPPPPPIFGCDSATAPCKEGAPPPSTAAPAIPEVTLADLASFRPTVPTLSTEPDGVGVAGLPVNLVGGVDTQVVTGSLFGFPVSVRFTPHHYDWAYGDGETLTTTSGGTTWASSAQPQFTATATSHTYRERGEYPASVRVSYVPDVTFADGTWRPVAGYVTATSAARGIRIFEARTALVAHTCIENPQGPGC